MQWGAVSPKLKKRELIERKVKVIPLKEATPVDKSHLPSLIECVCHLMEMMGVEPSPKKRWVIKWRNRGLFEGGGGPSRGL